MKAVVMAGGEGSRLRPLTVGRPKPMVPIVNRPVMEHILLLLKRHGITEVVVTVQYLARMIQDYFGDGESLGMKLHYSVEDVPLGTAGSVKLAEHLLAETFMVISGDALTDFDLTKIINYHHAAKSVATLTLTRVAEPLEYGVVITDPNGRIRRFQEKPSWSEVISDTINTGIYVLEPEVLQRCPVGQPFDFSHDLFPGLLADDRPMFGYIAEGYWTDVGTIGEYARASFDLLDGKVQAEIGEECVQDNIWCGEGADISPRAKLKGPVYIGHDVKIGPGVVIDGPAVIGDNTIVEDHAHIARSIIWRSCYIGERTELRGAIVGDQCQLKTNAVLFEGAVVGDGSTVEEGAIIQANVKIWPNKEIEAGASVSSSIIWGRQGQRMLFRRHAVSGLINVDITPEFAAKLGAAYGATLPLGSTVAINRDLFRTSRMIKRAIISGLPSAGVNVTDCSSLPVPVARYYIRTNKDITGGIHVRLSPHDGRVVEAQLIDRNGQDMSKNAERKIESLFFREDFRRAQPDDIGSISYANDAAQQYCNGFLEQVDASRVRGARLRLVVDYCSGPTATILPGLLDTLGCEVLSLNAAVQDNLPGMPASDSATESLRRVGAITAALSMDLGVVIDTTGEAIYFVDEQGKPIPPMTAFAAMTLLAFQAQEGVSVAAPVTASHVLERIAEEYGGVVTRTKADRQALMAARDGVKFAGDGEGRFIIPRFHNAFDAMIALVKLLELLAVTDTTLSKAVRALPAHFIGTADVPCAWDQKGRVMRVLNESYGNGSNNAVDGIHIDLGEEWVLVLPDADRPFFHIVSEGRTQRSANSLAEKYASLVNGLQR
ncbi:MAG TPA: mannose-1-phosphate guanyltransferase [Chloroflexota bacterium]|nr:mannose-1-phosphate guanyltransferase [Chloroflexota bacterium]